MDPNELGFNAWILIGNVLTTTLSPTPTAGLTPAPSIRERLLSLQTVLDPIPPERMLVALSGLSADDLHLLRSLCIQSYNALGEEAATILGLEEATAAPVLEYLENPQNLATN